MSDAPDIEVGGRLVLDDRVVPGTLRISGDRIADVTPADESPAEERYLVPGFVDLHVHGWGGHDAMGGALALDGMAQALLRRGVTSFLPTAVSAPMTDLTAFAATVRSWMAGAPADGAEPLGFNLEGPFLADAKRGAHDAAHLRTPASVQASQLQELTDGLRVITVAPELDGALEAIRWLSDRGVVVCLGHSAATFAEALAGYAAGALSTTHLFNAMRGIEHRNPGLALAALLDDDVWVELIADGIHVDPVLWPLISRVKPPDRILLVSDAISLAGTGDGRGRIGDLEVEVTAGRVTLLGTSTLAGSVLSLDVAVRQLVASGMALPAAVAAATRNPLALLGISDRGRIAPGMRADLVELDADLRVRRVMRGGRWIVSG